MKSPDASDLYRELIESVTDYAIFALDAKGHILSWNSGAVRIKGYNADEIVGRHFSRFFPPEEIESGKPFRLLRGAAEGGRLEDEGWRVRKDGSRFWASAVLTALRDNDGSLIGFVKITRDLTARREAEAQAQRLAAAEAARAEAERRSEELARLNDQLQQQAAELEAQASQLEQQAAELEAQTEELHALTEDLRQKNDQLEAALSETRSARESAEQAAAAAAEAYRELDQFAYVASHDLKAPLRGIANLAQWIQEDTGERLAAQSIEHLRLLQGRVRRMEALIDGILAYSRAGRVLGAPELIDTGDLVREVLELLVVPDTATIEVAPMMPSVLAERVPLQQVFLNLLGNALKYTQAFRPDVVIRVAWRDAGDRFEFLVTDNGPGIDPQYHERIWGVFQTLAARDKVEGTGIGLSVVKKIVESRGGSTSLESAPHRGATFGFTWPKTSKGGLLR